MNIRKQLFIICGLMLLMIGIDSCDDPVTNELEDLYPQEQIPWPSLADTPWPMVGHDPQNTNRTIESGILAVAGVLSISSDSYFQSPIVMDEDNGVLRIGIDTGFTVMEHYDSNGGVEEYITIQSNGIIAVPTMLPENRIYIPGKGKIWVLDGLGKEILWEDASHNHPTRVTVGLEDELYFFTNDPTNLVSLSSQGIVRWIYPNPGNDNMGWTGLAMSPDGEQLYFSGGTNITCLSTNGEVIWQYPVGSLRVYSIMVDNDGNIYFYVWDERNMVCLTSDGELRWQASMEDLNLLKIDGTQAPTIDFHGNLYYVARDTSNTPGVISLNNDGQPRWFFEMSIQSGLICDINNYIHFGSSFPGDNHVGVISADGELIWDFVLPDISGDFAHAPVITSEGEIIYPLNASSQSHLIKLY